MFNFERKFTKNNTITFERAQDELGVNEKDVAHLPSEQIRSPYNDQEWIKGFFQEIINCPFCFAEFWF